jgi:ER membrane protein complex subunit 10
MKTNYFLVCALCASLAHADVFPKLYHRVWNPSDLPQPFSLRATVQNSQESGLVLIAADNVDQLILDPGQPEGLLYQVALQRAGDFTENDWDISSVKAVRFNRYILTAVLSSVPGLYCFLAIQCHAAGIKSDIIKLHLSSSETVYAIDYFVHPVPRDGRCPKKKPSSRTQISFTNTTLIIGTAGEAPL